MAIIFEEDAKTFTLHTDNTTYQMQIDPYGYLLHLYYGTRTGGCMDYLLTMRDRGFSGNPYDAGKDRTYSMDVLPQEYPVQGTGDYRSPMLSVKDADGVFGCDLRYKSHKIWKGKYALKGLPAVYSETAEDEAETLELVLEDRRLQMEVTLYYGVLPHIDIITRAAAIKNTGRGEFSVEKAQTACLDFVHGDFDLTVFYGKHMMERIPDRQPVSHGVRAIGSRRGSSSHHYNPFLILSDRDATECHGRCWSMQFVYSGGFLAETEKDQFGQTRMQMGLMQEQFSYPLQGGEELVLPEVILSFSAKGLGQLSRNHHTCIRRHICRGPHRDVVRPLLINSWEASYFDFTGDSICKLAEDAKALGIEMVVMDDGWFGKRSDDYRGLGDWKPNEQKLGGTLGSLISRINGLGMKFGIWVEPEMISEDSDLYREHPDWALAIPDKKPVRARHQLVLDFSRKEVVDAMYDQLCRMLDEGPIDYLKWDYNRNIAEVYSHTTKDQGKVLYDYYIGLYELLERLLARYPKLLIEGCSGGGGRFDAGMLYYTPQIWCSDNTDAIDRLRIQYGTSFGYPVSAVGAHVSICPNEQTGRSVPLETRAAVAMAGTFGYELAPSRMTEEEKELVRKQAEAWHRDAPLIQNGSYYRLTALDDSPVCAWEMVSEDGSRALLTIVVTQIHGNADVNYVRLQGLSQGAFYHVGELERSYPSEALMDMGLPIPDVRGDYQSFVYHLERV